MRAVEPAHGRRSYLCAFEGPAFVCLDDRLAAERDARRVREAASASLLWEQVEALVDADALRDLAAAVGRLLARGGDPPEVAASLEVVAARALDLARWRDDPARAVASVPDLDTVTALQERLVGAYRRFLRASEPLVEVQDRLDAGLVDALRDVEERARAGGGRRAPGGPPRRGHARDRGRRRPGRARPPHPPERPLGGAVAASGTTPKFSAWSAATRARSSSPRSGRSGAAANSSSCSGE